MIYDVQNVASVSGLFHDMRVFVSRLHASTYSDVHYVFGSPDSANPEIIR